MSYYYYNIVTDQCQLKLHVQIVHLHVPGPIVRTVNYNYYNKYSICTCTFKFVVLVLAYNIIPHALSNNNTLESLIGLDEKC